MGEKRGTVGAGEPATWTNRTGFLSDSIDNMCASHVYKRRKLRNSVALLSDDNGIGGTKGSSASDPSMNSECISLERQNGFDDRIPGIPLIMSISGQFHMQKHDDLLALQSDGTRNLVPISTHVEERQLSVELPMNGVQKLALDYNSVNDSCSSSKSNMEQDSSLMKVQVEDAGECSSSDILLTEPSVQLGSAKDLCISLLGNCDQSREDPPSNACTSLDILCGNDARFSMSCKVCGVKDSVLKMLICDLCDEAFHLSCCKAKKLPADEWYCQPCMRKKPKVLPETLSGQLFYIMGEKRKKRMLKEKLGPIITMLQDTVPYVSGVRIGKDFQVEVTEWTGPISDDDDYFGEPSVLDPSDWDSLNGWSFNRPSRLNSIGNWLQCRAMIYNERDQNDEGIVCGKWRRAPIFISQTEDWDCSCAVLWDPIHADCAVPQELETSEVLKQLKYVELANLLFHDYRSQLHIGLNMIKNLSSQVLVHFGAIAISSLYKLKPQLTNKNRSS